MTDTRREGSDPNRTLDSHLAELFGLCVDRHNAGEPLDLEALRREHPDCAEELIERLRVFQALDSKACDGAVADVFGGYRIVRELGRGGMGVVYEAVETAMERRVALKVLPAGLRVDQRSVVRFRREARVIAKLRHPNIVAIYATGVEGGTPYIAMEFVEGETLDKVLARKRPARAEDSRSLASKVLTGISRAFRAVTPAAETVADAPAVLPGAPLAVPEDALAHAATPPTPIPSSTADMDLGYALRMAKTFAQVALGLQHAHSQGIVHRDLKPSNLILDRDGQLRILDFGLARLEGQESLTHSTEIVGTPRYMSPEQARAGEGSVDARSDVWSLGATLYEVLTLAPAFAGKTAQETLSQILHRDPRPLRHFNPRLPRDLETIVLKCLRKDPAGRYGTAEALAQDLERFARGDPIEARPQSFGERSARRLRQHRGKVVVGSALVLLLGVALVLWQRGAEEMRKRRLAEYDDRVLDGVVKLQLAGALSEKAGDFVWEGEGYDTRLLGEGLEESELRSDLTAAAIRALREASVSVPERGDAHYHLARGLFAMARPEEARSALDRAVELGFLPALTLKASMLKSVGEDAAATDLLEEARKRGAGDWAEAWLRAHAAAAERRWDEAATAYEDLIEIEKRSGGPYAGSTVDAYLGCGVARLEGGRYDKAQAAFVAASALRAGSVEPEVFLAATYHLQGNREEAAALLERLWQRAPTLELAATVVLILWRRLEDYDKALEWIDRMGTDYRKALMRAACLTSLGRAPEAIQATQLLVEMNPRTALSHFLDAVAHMQSGDFEAAGRAAAEAAKLAPRSCAPLVILASAEFMSGKLAQSFETLQAAARVEPSASAPYFFLGQAYRNMGLLDESADALTRAIGRGGRAAGLMFAPWMLHALRGEVLEELGRPEEALRDFRETVSLAGVGPRRALEDPDWVWRLAWAHLRAGNPADALLRIAEAVETFAPVGSELERWERMEREALQKSLPELPTLRAVDLALATIDEVDLVPAGAVWRYHPGASPPSAGIEWTGGEFDDSRWREGPSPLGYGDPGIATVLGKGDRQLKSLYIRHRFQAAPRSDAADVVLSVEADDGCIVYLDGKDVLRVRAPDGEVIPHDALATATAREPLCPEKVSLGARWGEGPGPHVLAVHLLNASATSSDLAVLPVLRAVLKPDPKRGERLLAQSRTRGSGKDADLCRTYLEGRLLEMRGDHAAAVEVFGAAVAASPNGSLPQLALARCLRSVGKTPEAERSLRAWIAEQRPARREAWNMWLQLALGELGRDPSEVRKDLASIPSRAPTPHGAAARGFKRADECRWLLDRLAANEAIRIRSGGGAYTDRSGRVWAGDCFYSGGEVYSRGRQPFNEDIADTEDDPLYRTERTFDAAPALLNAYEVPLPRGRYRVSLHFAETWDRRPGQCSFDVVLEGAAVIEDYRPDRNGFAHAEVLTFEVDVDDGALDVDFRRRRGDPKVSAMEVDSRQSTGQKKSTVDSRQSTVDSSEGK
jgi:serine/threonine protein kinase/predicted Zn-dependent protease